LPERTKVLNVLEEWKNKQVKIFLTINEQPVIYTGKILEETETHFRFRDKFGQELLLSKTALQQVKGAENNV